MPLIKSCSIDAFRKNIAAERATGKPLDQAVAIARRTLDMACREAGMPIPAAKGGGSKKDEEKKSESEG